MFETLFLVLAYIAFVAFGAKRLLTYLHILQQDDYDNARVMRWMFEYGVFDRRLSLAILVIGGLWLFLPAILTSILLIAAFAICAWLEADPREASKKKLVMTQRARRIFLTAICIAAITGLWCFAIPLPWLWILSVQLVPFSMFMANILLIPVERSIQQKLWNEAYARLTACGPKVIGITGSFGKTSVKHILGHILKTQAPTLVTPGSVNTPMGVVRIIREQLEDNHKYFVVEMGAYGPGSIAKLCRLTPPDLGIITSIGHAHYERFKSLDTVAEAKFELAEAVIAKNGKVVIHDSTLPLDHVQKMRNANPDKFIVCGIEQDKDDLHIMKIQQSADGLTVEIGWNNTIHTLQAPLYGLHHGSNIALAFAAAVELGIAPENIRIALRSTPQITHRLEVKKQPDGTTIIDDAFNSNPQGFRSALELLNTLGTTGRKILITPGMVELGAAHEKEHFAIGQLAGQICDVAIAVNPARIRDFIRGFQDTGKGKELIEVTRFTGAAAWLDTNKRPGDVILIENDLPDLYERIPKI